MITQTCLKAKLRKPRAESKFHIALNPDVLYTRAEAAIAVRASTATLVRAFLSGHLTGLCVGNRVKHSGQHLLEWMLAGGKTA